MIECQQLGSHLGTEAVLAIDLSKKGPVLIPPHPHPML